MRACLCVCVHACACCSLKFSYFISFHLCVFACALLSSPSLSLSLSYIFLLATFRRLVHNGILGAAQFVCGLYAIFHLNPTQKPTTPLTSHASHFTYVDLCRGFFCSAVKHDRRVPVPGDSKSVSATHKEQLKKANEDRQQCLTQLT